MQSIVAEKAGEQKFEVIGQYTSTVKKERCSLLGSYSLLEAVQDPCLADDAAHH